MITPFRLSAGIGILFIMIALFVNVNMMLPLIGAVLCLASLVMDLVFSLKSESGKIESALKSVDERINAVVKVRDAALNSIDMRLSRIESDRLYK